MADAFRTAFAWLGQQRSTHAVHSVRYRRGESNIVVNATVGRTTFRLEDGYGRMIRSESRDFLVDAASLVIGGERVTPEVGDRVVDGDGVYEAMSFGEGGHWRWSDPYHKTLRLHTKFVGNA